MPPQRHTPQPRVRQRSSKACEPCRKRKVKCDGKLPCDICKGYEYECSFRNGIDRVEKRRDAGNPLSSVDRERENGHSNDVQSLSNGFPSTHVQPLQKMTPDENDESPAFVATEVMVPKSDMDPFLLLPWKTRFTIAHSAIAMPRSLGISLGLQNPPRLQSFGWNAGMRAEPKISPQANIRDMISLEDINPLVDVYFNEVHPFFDMLVREKVLMRNAEYWAGGKQSLIYEACLCGVLALGSYFSKTGPSPVEAQIVEHGRLMLDLSTAHAPALLSIKHVTAWILRAIYLRLTTRPHLSWMASCTAVLLAESVGLHRELEDSKLCRESPREYMKWEVDLRRRVFWIAISLNQFMSSEYGRTRIHIDLINCEALQPRAGDFTADIVAIFMSVPSHKSTTSIPEMLDALKRATALPTRAGWLGVLRVDACFCIYRMLRISGVTLPGSLHTALLDVIKVGLDGVTFLSSMQKAWWNIIGIPFHSVCVLLALATPESLAMIPTALGTLKNTVSVFDSHFSREALSTAYSLTEAVRKRKSKELEDLNQGLLLVGEARLVQETTPINTPFNWPIDLELGFSDFFDSRGYGLGAFEGQEWPAPMDEWS